MTYYSYKKYFLIGKPNLTKTYLFPSAQKTQLLCNNPTKTIPPCIVLPYSFLEIQINIYSLNILIKHLIIFHYSDYLLLGFSYMVDIIAFDTSICLLYTSLLSFDVYMKKNMIESLIDDYSAKHAPKHPEKPDKTDKKK